MFIEAGFHFEFYYSPSEKQNKKNAKRKNKQTRKKYSLFEKEQKEKKWKETSWLKEQRIDFDNYTEENEHLQV